jgi:non-specific serine/threonine protein kinase
LRNPNQECHVLDLVAVAAVDEASPNREARELTHCGLRSSGLSDADAILDPEARTAYRQRLEDLREELAEAEEFNDTERADRLQEQIEFLTHELANAVGLGGCNREAAAHTERARVNVARAIKAVIKKTAEQHPALERYLATTIKTGMFCSYTPDPRFPVTWQF